MPGLFLPIFALFRSFMFSHVLSPFNQRGHHASPPTFFCCIAQLSREIAPSKEGIGPSGLCKPYLRAGKNNFCGPKLVVQDPLLDHKSPPRVYVGHSLHKQFSGAQRGFWGGSQKLMSEKFICVFCPLLMSRPQEPINRTGGLSAETISRPHWLQGHYVDVVD